MMMTKWVTPVLDTRLEKTFETLSEESKSSFKNSADKLESDMMCELALDWGTGYVHTISVCSSREQL